MIWRSASPGPVRSGSCQRSGICGALSKTGRQKFVKRRQDISSAISSKQHKSHRIYNYFRRQQLHKHSGQLHPLHLSRGKRRWYGMWKLWLCLSCKLVLPFNGKRSASVHARIQSWEVSCGIQTHCKIHMRLLLVDTRTGSQYLHDQNHLRCLVNQWLVCFNSHSDSHLRQKYSL